MRRYPLANAAPAAARAFALLVAVSGLAALPAVGAPAAPKPAASSGEGGEGHLKAWEWANFLVLAAGLGYLAGKHGGPFFAARSTKIRTDIAAAGDLRKQSEARAAEVERRLAGIESDIAALREEAGQEARAEAGRVARQTAAEAAKIQAQAEQDIASAVKAARTELKRHSAELAVALAEQLVRARMTPAAQDELVRTFLRDLDRPSSGARPT
jgi:F-type H+-transporting ATPase subunit b